MNDTKALIGLLTGVMTFATAMTPLVALLLLYLVYRMTIQSYLTLLTSVSRLLITE